MHLPAAGDNRGQVITRKIIRLRYIAPANPPEGNVTSVCTGSLIADLSIQSKKQNIVSLDSPNFDDILRKSLLERGLTRQRARKSRYWTCWLSWSLVGLAGCATFDSKYERVEITSPDSASAGIAAASGGKGSGKLVVPRGMKSDRSGRAGSITQTSYKPAAPGKFADVDDTTARVSISTKHGREPTSAIQQVAFSQTDAAETVKEPAGQEKSGIEVPEVGSGEPAKPEAAASELPVPPAGPIVDTAIEIQSPDGATGINLDQTINFCMISDPVIRAGLESINQSNAEALTASLIPNPQFFTDLQLMPLTHKFTPTRQGGPPQFDAILSYPIDWFLFGKRAAMMDATDLGVRVTQSEYQDLIRVRVLEAAVSYYGVLEAKALRDVARQDVENFRRIEALTSSAVDNGGRAKVDLNRIRLDRLRSEHSLRDAENALIAAFARLRVLLGADVNDPAFDVVGSLDAVNVIEPLPIDEAVQIADQNRPDLEAARWKIAQADAVIESERRKAYPTVIPSWGYTRQYQNKAIGYPNADSWLVNMTVSLPFFDRNQGNQAKASSVAAQAGYQLQARRVALRGEVVKATQELTTSAANTQAVAKDQLEIAQQVRDSINSAYEAGGRPLLDALDAQRNYRETYRLFIISRANYARAAIQYSATLGQQMTP